MNPNKPNPSPYATSADPMAPERLAPWRLPDEDEVLERVQRRLHVDYFTPDETERATAKGWLGPRWSLASVMVALAVAVVVFWWLPAQQHPSRLRYKGAFRHLSQASKGVPSSAPLALNVPAGQTGEISLDKAWYLRATSNTRLTLAPRSSQQTVALHRGHIHVHVRPGSMTSFAVQASEITVSVRGTIFSVERTKHWLRLEVWRGKVALESSGPIPEMLATQRQGIRVDRRTHTTVRYPLPPVTHRTPSKRWRWVYQQGGDKALRRYLSDVAASQRYSAQTKRALFASAADWFHGRRRYVDEYRLRKRIVSLAQRGEKHEQKLFESAQACRRAYGIVRLECQQQYRRYLKEYSEGNAVYRDASLFWSAAGRALVARTPAQAIQWLRRYVKQSPRGYFAAEVKTWWRNRSLTPQFCRWARPRLARSPALLSHPSYGIPRACRRHWK